MSDEIMQDSRNPLPEGWEVGNVNDPKLLAKILDNYANAIPEDSGAIGFVNLLASGLLLVHEVGWLLVERVTGAGAAFIHGGKFCEGREHVPHFRAILRWITNGGARCVVSLNQPSSAARVLLVDVGFMKAGMIPFYHVVRGKPEEVDVWVWFPVAPSDDGGKEE